MVVGKEAAGKRQGASPITAWLGSVAYPQRDYPSLYRRIVRRIEVTEQFAFPYTMFRTILEAMTKATLPPPRSMSVNYLLDRVKYRVKERSLIFYT